MDGFGRPLKVKPRHPKDKKWTDVSGTGQRSNLIRGCLTIGLAPLLRVQPASPTWEARRAFLQRRDPQGKGPFIPAVYDIGLAGRWMARLLLMTLWDCDLWTDAEARLRLLPRSGKPSLAACSTSDQPRAGLSPYPRCLCVSFPSARQVRAGVQAAALLQQGGSGVGLRERPEDYEGRARHHRRCGVPI